MRAAAARTDPAAGWPTVRPPVYGAARPTARPTARPSGPPLPAGRPPQRRPNEAAGRRLQPLVRFEVEVAQAAADRELPVDAGAAPLADAAARRLGQSAARDDDPRRRPMTMAAQDEDDRRRSVVAAHGDDGRWSSMVMVAACDDGRQLPITNDERQA